MSLEIDRVFDTTEIDALASETKTLMDTADTVIGEIYSELSSLSSTLASLPADVKDSGLKQQVDDLKGSIKTTDFKEYSSSIKKRLKSLNTSITNGDKKYGTEIAGIAVDLCTVVTQLEGLKNLIPAGADSGTYADFKKEFDSYVGSWKILKDKMGEIKQSLIEAILGSDNDGVEKSDDPVNLSTGNFIYEKEDMQTAGKPALSLRRFYNALDNTEGTLGKGWRHSYEIHLEVKPDEAVVFLPDGKKLSFQEKKNQTYYSDATRMRLLKLENGFSLHQPDSGKFLFDLEGNCQFYEDERGERICFTVEDGKLVKALRLNDDAFYAFFYEENGNLSEVRDQEGRSVTYEYGEDGRLFIVSRLAGGVFTYSYDENGYIQSVASADGTKSVENKFDREGRCVFQHFPDGSTMSFDYETEDSCVILTERNGSQIRYYHDKYYHNVRTVYEDGEERFLYNRKGQCTYYKNQNGAVTRYAYDPRGNVTQVIDALGNKTNATYDAKNHLISLKVNGKLKIHNEYNAKGELVKTVGADGFQSMLEYGADGNPCRLVLPDGGSIRLSFDERGNLSGITDVFGATNRYEYDALNRVTAVTDGNGNVTRYRYNQAGDITSVLDPAGNSRSYEYNERGRVTEITDFDGFRIHASYNTLNRPERITDKEGNETLYSYDNMWNLSSQTSPDGGKTDFIYNSANRLEQVALPNGGSIRHEYDAAGNRTAVTDAEGNKTSYSYDSLNRVTEVTDADGGKTVYEYDAEGNLACVTDALGNSRSFGYDEAGRKSRETDPLGNTTKYAYTPLGDIREIIYPNGSRKIYEYEAGGRLVQITQPGGASVRYAYDSNGNVLSETNNLGQALVYEYDSLNRITSATSPNGGVKCYEYDAVGNVTKITDENGNATEYSYSPNGNLTCVKDAIGLNLPFGNETKYEYDCMGRLVKIDRIGDAGESVNAGEDATEGQPVLPVHQITTYQRNTSGLVECITNPLGIVESYRYDKNGNVMEKTDGDGYTTKYSYNRSGDLTDILYADGKTVKYSYNALRQLEEMKDWLGTTKLKLDALGRPLSVTDYRGKTVSYEWGSMGEKKKIIYPDGKEAIYSYNNALQLTSLNGMGNQKDIAYEYDRLGRLTSKHLPNGIDTEYQYNNIGRLERLTHKGKNGMAESYRYMYDLAGNKIQTERQRTELPEDSGMFRYQYDELNRLTGVLKDGEVLRNYRYDAFGNRTLKTEYTEGLENSTLYQYNEGGQLIKSADAGFEKNYQYDGRGNISRVMTGEKLLKRYLFNTANQMERAETFTGQLEKQEEYGYNGFGKRISQELFDTDDQKKLNPMQKIEYTLDITRQYYDLLSSEDGISSKKQYFFWDGNVAGMSENGRNSYYLQDDLGSVMSLTAEDGGNRELFAYDEFGMPVVHRNFETANIQGAGRAEADLTGNRFAGMVQPFAFTGYQPDETTGLYYAQARRYDAGVGRFVSEDRIKGFAMFPSTLNEYNYCISNPLIYVDEDGQFWHIVIGAVVGAVVNVGFTIYDEYKDGTLNFKSVETWKDIGVSAFKGGVEGAVGAALGPVGAGIATAGIEFGTDTMVQIVNNEKITLGENTFNAVLSGITAYGFGKAGDKLKDLLYGKSKIILSSEIKDILDYLAKYSRSGAEDANQALKLIASYIAQETGWGLTSNRASWGENELYNLLLDGVEKG